MHLLHIATYVAEGDWTMIDGLKLTFAGEELRKLLEERIAFHNMSADRWRREQSRTPASETEDAPLLPDHICEHETDRHDWRATALEFSRSHIEPQATYRLGAADLEFGELLPPKPASIAQEDYEEGTAVGFHLERLTKRVGELACRSAAAAVELPAPYKATRVDVENGPEI